MYLHEAQRRTGFANFGGYLVGGMKMWQNAGLPLKKLPQMSVQELKEDHSTQRLDVRSPSLSVCAQALAHRGYSTEEVASSVKVAFSAATVNINKQTAGYAYLPFH